MSRLVDSWQSYSVGSYCTLHCMSLSCYSSGDGMSSGLVRGLANDAWNCGTMATLCIHFIHSPGKTSLPSKAIHRMYKNHALEIVLQTWIPWLIALFLPDFVSICALCSESTGQLGDCLGFLLIMSLKLAIHHGYTSPEGK